MQTNNLLVMEIKTGKNRKRNPCESVFKNDKSNDKSMDNPASQDLKIFSSIEKEIRKTRARFAARVAKELLICLWKRHKYKELFYLL
jgi:hypothetical protein